MRFNEVKRQGINLYRSYNRVSPSLQQILQLGSARYFHQNYDCSEIAINNFNSMPCGMIVRIVVKTSKKIDLNLVTVSPYAMTNPFYLMDGNMYVYHDIFVLDRFVIDPFIEYCNGNTAMELPDYHRLLRTLNPYLDFTYIIIDTYKGHTQQNIRGF